MGIRNKLRKDARIATQGKVNIKYIEKDPREL